MKTNIHFLYRQSFTLIQDNFKRTLLYINIKNKAYFFNKLLNNLPSRLLLRVPIFMEKLNNFKTGESNSASDFLNEVSNDASLDQLGIL
jgi:hypothetical protein